jgi:dipeptidyl aminopeptidase/acylaminoacyl peptidase
LSRFCIASLLIIFLTSCSPSTAIPATVEFSATPTVRILPTATLTPTSDTLPTIDPSLLKTPFPTETSTPKPPDQILNSPNGEFAAEFDNAYSHPAYEPQVIQILDKNGSLLWEIPYQHEVSQSDPHPSLTIYGWSEDSKYLYFYYDFSPDGGDYAFWWDGFDLQRINAENGEIEQVIPGDREKFVAFSFSPDAKKIAYTREQDNPSIFYIRNLVTETEKDTKVIGSPSMNYIRVGSIEWSPSGDKIAFQTESDDYKAQTIYLDPSTMKQKIVREYMVDTSYFDGWSDDENLSFLDIDGGTADIVHLNIKNGEVVKIGTPTPRP